MRACAKTRLNIGGRCTLDPIDNESGTQKGYGDRERGREREKGRERENVLIKKRRR